MALLDQIVRNAVATVGNVIGFSAVLRREVITLDIETETNTAQITDYPVKLLPLETFSIQQVDGEKILSGDVKVSMVSSGAPEPDPKTDKLIINNIHYKVISHRYVSAGQLPALHVIQCRK